MNRRGGVAWWVLCSWCCGLVLVSCSSVPQSGTSLRPAASSPSALSSAVGPGEAAWQIPAADLASQRLFRVRYDGPEGEVGLRLTLWLAAPNRYQLSAADLFGRAVWSLAVDGEDGLWLDHRNALYCRFAGTIELSAVPLSPFRFTALPALLLGRLPEPPAAGIAVAGEPAGDPAGEYVDNEGQKWSYKVLEGRLVQWTVWRQGEPVAWWSATGKEAILSQRGDGVQIRWREVVREPMPHLPVPPSVPASYSPHCADG